ncbi:uncharacterized protein LOC125573819 [Nematostella vectensis]|uniref:uncharacterized protein LOC125573819 n=1 Tax=Nematostella vectensis TaxID=45351 RepID=UPI00207735CF|nr:uncharacterized protein LOC125573819 [Nematostella vectensis]
MCGLKDETVNHLLCECSKMAQSQYKHRHDNVARIVHWAIAKEHGFEVKEKWYEHELLPVIEKPDLKILWDVTIQTDREIQARRPDIVIVNRKEGECIVIDIAVPGDANVGEKEKEKVLKYQDIRREIARLWDIKTCVVPIVVGALGTVSKNLTKHLSSIGLKTRIELLQKGALLGSAWLLRQVLEV